MGSRIGVGGLGLIPALEVIKTDQRRNVTIVAADTLRFRSSDVICAGELKKPTTICLNLAEETGGLLRILR